MWRYLLALILIAGLLVGGCGGEESGIGTTLQSDDLDITLDYICWIDELGGPSWTSNLFWLVVSLPVKNLGAHDYRINYEDIYLITAQGKVYENSEIVFGLPPYAYWEFKPNEVDTITHLWYFSMYEPDAPSELEELKELSGVNLVVGNAEFRLPHLGTLDLLTEEQYFNQYGEYPPPLMR